MADAASTSPKDDQSTGEGAAAPNPIQQAMFDYHADFSDFHNAARARVGLQPHVNTQPAGVFQQSQPTSNPNPFSYKNPFAK